MFVLFYLQLDATLYISPEEWTGGQADWQVHHCRVLLSPFEEYLRKFRGEESSPKYDALALELVKTKEITPWLISETTTRLSWILSMLWNIERFSNFFAAHS